MPSFYPLIFFLFLSGLFFGSFLNVVIDRLPRSESFLKGRSHCDFCKHTLSWYDLVPVVSFVILRGRCRYCKKFIGFKYPVIELSTGIAFALGTIYLYQNNQNPLALIYYLLIASSLIIVFFIDAFERIIPDSVIIPMGIVSFIYWFFVDISSLPWRILAGIVSFLFFLFLAVVTKGKGMGMGDVKFVLVMGIILGFPATLVSLYIAFISGAVISVILLAVHRKKMKSTIAFGPFLVLGTISSLLFAENLWKIILTFFS